MARPELGEPLAKSSARRMAPSMAVRHRSMSGWPSGRRLRDSTRRAQRAARATIARSGSFFRSSVEIFGTIMIRLSQMVTDTRRSSGTDTETRLVLASNRCGWYLFVSCQEQQG